MAEFILDIGSPDVAREFNRLDEFTRGYIEAMFFTETGTGDDAENDLEHATVAELDCWSVEKIKRDCAEFQRSCGAYLEQAYTARHSYEPVQAGRDFWFTRNGHGVGFWNRGLGEIGETLSAFCGWQTPFDECGIYRGDDDKIYYD